MKLPPPGSRLDTAWKEDKDIVQGKLRSPKATVFTYSFMKSQPWRMLFCLFWVLVFSRFGLNEIRNTSHPVLFLAQNEHKINGECLSRLLFKVQVSSENQLDHIYLK